jgi:hypothetical protein
MHALALQVRGSQHWLKPSARRSDSSSDRWLLRLHADSKVARLTAKRTTCSLFLCRLQPPTTSAPPRGVGWLGCCTTCAWLRASSSNEALRGELHRFCILFTSAPIFSGLPVQNGWQRGTRHSYTRLPSPLSSQLAQLSFSNRRNSRLSSLSASVSRPRGGWPSITPMIPRPRGVSAMMTSSGLLVAQNTCATSGTFCRAGADRDQRNQP